MPNQKPIIISKNAFRFCRYAVAALLLSALLTRGELFLWAVFLILFLSAVLGISRAPLVSLYSYFEKLFKIKPALEIVDVNAMRFAHSLGSLLAGICLGLLLLNSRYAWPAVLLFTIIKTISAAGFCPASKLYACSTGGSSCCRFLKHK